MDRKYCAFLIFKLTWRHRVVFMLVWSFLLVICVPAVLCTFLSVPCFFVCIVEKCLPVLRLMLNPAHVHLCNTPCTVCLSFSTTIAMLLYKTYIQWNPDCTILTELGENVMVSTCHVQSNPLIAMLVCHQNPIIY